MKPHTAGMYTAICQRKIDARVFLIPSDTVNSVIDFLTEKMTKIANDRFIGAESLLYKSALYQFSWAGRIVIDGRDHTMFIVSQPLLAAFFAMYDKITDELHTEYYYLSNIFHGPQFNMPKFYPSFKCVADCTNFESGMHPDWIRYQRGYWEHFPDDEE